MSLSDLGALFLSGAYACQQTNPLSSATLEMGYSPSANAASQETLFFHQMPARINPVLFPTDLSDTFQLHIAEVLSILNLPPSIPPQSLSIQQTKNT